MYKCIKFFIFALAIVLMGCNNSKKEIVKIGVVASLTGTGSMAAQYCIDGLDLAIKELNSIDGGIRYEIIYEDCQSNPNLTGNCFKRLEMKGAKYIIVLGGQFALVAAPLSKGKNMMYFSTGDYNESVLTMTDCGFRVFPNAITVADISSRFLRDSLKVSKIATISMNTVPCLIATNKFEEFIKQQNGEIVYQDKYDIGTSDFRNTIAKLANTGVEAVFFNGFGISPAAFCSQLSQYPQFDNLIIMGDMNFSTKNFAQDNKNDKLRIYYADTEMSGIAAQKYFDDNRIRPNSFVSCCYMLPYLIDKAITAVPDVNDFKAQRKALIGHTIDTPAGRITFDDNGNANLDMKIFSLK